MKTDKAKPENQEEQPKHPAPDHASQGHTTENSHIGSATSSKEPTLRSVTTDSSRVHKHRSDDMPTGGNVR